MSGVRRVKLGELFAESAGSVDPQLFPREMFELWSIPAYDTSKPEITSGAGIGSVKKVVQTGDVLLSRIVPHIRRAWVVHGDTDLRRIASGEWIVFRGDFFPEYIRHYLLSDVFHKEFMRTVAGVGGSLLRARPSGVALISVPLPSLKEQRFIAAILDQADTIRRQRRAALERLDDLKAVTFIEMFGNPASNPKKLPIGTISDLAESTQYGTSSPAEEGGALPILRMGNITYTGELDLKDLKYINISDRDLAKYTVKDGDILFNRTNSPELVGKTTIFRGSEPYAFAGYLVRLRTNKCADPEYISAFLNSRYGKAVLRGMCKSIIGMANINAKELMAIPIPIPPLSLQQAFAERVRAIEALKEQHRAHLAQLDTLFASLQHRAFSGEL